MADLIQLRGDTSGNWTATNPILGSREFGIETDTGKGKVGNGVTAWNSLAYSFFTNVGDIVAGTNVSMTGTLTGRLIGSGNVTINASSGGASAPTQQIVTASARVDNLVLEANAEVIVFNGTGIELTGMIAGSVVRRITIVNVTGDFFYISLGYSAAENQFIQSFAMGTATSSEWIYIPSQLKWFKIGN